MQRHGTQRHWSLTGSKIVLLIALGSCPAVTADNAFYGPAYDAGGNVIPDTFNVYEVLGVDDSAAGFTAGAAWYPSHLAATGRTDPLSGSAITGNLASVTSQSKNDWLHALGGHGEAWIGATDDETIFGGVEAGSDQNGGWVWTNGDAYSYQNFSELEPNDAGGEDAVHFRGDGQWNDHKTDIPGTGQDGGPAYRSIVEYRTQTPLANLNAFKVTVTKAAGLIALDGEVPVLAAIETYQTGVPAAPFSSTSQVVETAVHTVATSSVSDTPVHFPNPNPFQGGGGDDFLIAGEGVLTSTGGLYTFGISGDDGGVFVIDFDNSGTFTEPGDDGEVIINDLILHGNQDKFGEVFLPAGTFGYAWVGFERGGGDGWDLFYSQDARLSFGDVADDTFNANIDNANGWYLMGDDTAGISSVAPDFTTPGLRITELKSSGVGLTSFAEVDALLSGGSDVDSGFGADGSGSFTVYAKTVNQYDSGDVNNPSFGGTDRTLQDGIPGLPGADGDAYVIVNEGFVDFTAAGDWTIAAYADDQHRLRIDLNRDGDFDDAGEEFRSPGSDCCTTELHAVNIPGEGRYPVEFLWYENGGGAYGELSAAQGVQTAFDDTVFSLIGDTANGGLAVWQVPGATGFVCDYDTDSDCDGNDLATLYAGFGSSDAAFDFDGSGTVDAADIPGWLDAASDPSNPFKQASSDVFVIGDIDFDGDVDSVDLGLLLNNFGNNAGVGWGGGDLNGDSNVGSVDLGQLLNNFGFVSPAANAAVPEPTGLTLLAMGFLGLLIGRRR